MSYENLLNLDFRAVNPAQGQRILGMQSSLTKPSRYLNLGFGSPSSLLGDNPLGLLPTPTLDFSEVTPASTLDFSEVNPAAKSGGLMSFLNNNAKGITAGTGLLTGLLGGYLGTKQLSLAKKQYEFEKDAFNRQYAAQRTTLNAEMRDRQQARVTARPWAAQAVEDYMKQNEVK